MSENSQESHMETAYEEVKMFLYSFFLGLNYFSNSKNKKGSCKQGNVMKNVCLCIYETKVWTISTLRNLFYKSYFAFVREKKRIQKERVISYHVRKFPVTCR